MTGIFSEGLVDPFIILPVAGIELLNRQQKFVLPDHW